MGFKKKKSRNFGHLQGVKAVQKIVKVSLEQKVPIISFYVFSTENWKRPKKEISFLFNLIKVYFKAELENIIKNNIKINIIGRSKNLPTKIKKILNEVVKKTKKNNKLTVNLAINYGSKIEIINSVKKIISKKKTLSEKNLSKNLYADLPDPDILIRTGGKKRLSNFMLWQLAYAELFFIEKLWPDFNKSDFIKILKEYHSIKRNFGGI